jgi:coenzyme PQQ precursor peptide PqqA
MASACIGRPRFPLEEDHMTWTKPEFEVVELGMEVGAYAGNA